MNYIVVSFTNPTELALKVTEMLNLGWECQGGISIHGQGANILFVQAMIKDYERS